jgi:nicotinamide phosphoribosyltransferase
MSYFKNKNSIILNTDSYKTSMNRQYPPKTEYVYSYIESRGGEYDKTVFFGLQSFLREVLSDKITLEQINFAERIITGQGCPFNRAGWEYILKNHNGYLPLHIKAMPEGTVIDKKNVLVTVVNTDPECFWLTTYVEPALLRAVWYGTTVASNSYTSKQIILKALGETGTPEDIDFKLHDFGTRGVSSQESSVLGGMAHLVNFKGTDNIMALSGAIEYYDARDIVGFSIPAMEHSTVTSWGRENETASYSNMLTQYAKPGAIVACVSDAYDIYAACHEWGTTLKQQVIDSDATIVVRPDSGDASSVIVECLRILNTYFGSVKNKKGYLVLNNVRVLQGDGINHASIRSILFSMKMAGFSADNIAFGQGGALLQGIDRDTLSFAMKCSAIMVDGEWRDVFKDPITDAGKKSKRGRFKVATASNIEDLDKSFFVTVSTADTDHFDAFYDCMKTVFYDGELLNETTFDQIRERANVKQ